MNNLCNENFILILIFVLFAYLLFQINNIKNTQENFGTLPKTVQDIETAAIQAANITIEVINQINNIYQADVQAIRNLAAIAKGLNNGNNAVIPGTISISGPLTVDSINVNTNLTVSGNINGLNLQSINTSVTSLSETVNKITAILNNQSSQQVYNSQTSLVANSQASQLAKAQSSQLAASQLVSNSQASQLAASQASLTANLQNNLSLQVGQNYNLQGAMNSQIIKDTNIMNSETVRNSNEAYIMNSQVAQIGGQQVIINSETVRNSNEASIMNSQVAQIGGQQVIINSETAQINSQQNIINSQASQTMIQNIPYIQLINIINAIKPWGMYSADNWSNNTLYDITGNGNNATTTNVTNNSGAGFGALGNIPYLSGTTTSVVNWPVGSIPTNFTIASVTRYTGGSNARILSSSPGNWLQGQHGGARGSCHYDGWKTSDTKSYGNVLDWAVCVGTNNPNIPAPSNIIIDNYAIGINNGGTGGNNYAMTINRNCCGQNSNWAFNQLIIWDQPLTSIQLFVVSTALNQMLKDGMTLQKLSLLFKIPITNKGLIASNPYNITDLPNLPSTLQSGYYYFISSSLSTSTLCYVKINYDGGNWLLAYETVTPKRQQDVNNLPYIPYTINNYSLLQNTTPRRISYNFFNGNSTVESGKPRDVWVSFDNMVYSPSQTAGANGTGTALARYDVPYGGSYYIPGTSTANGFANKYNLVNMNVISTSDTNLNTTSSINGRMQVWPSNYSPGNTLNCNGGYCYDNTGYGTDPNHGTFQIHSMTSYNNLSTNNNPFAIFGWCHHRNDGAPEIGIGPITNGNYTDYTFYNGTVDNFKLQIYIKM